MLQAGYLTQNDKEGHYNLPNNEIKEALINIFISYYKTKYRVSYEDYKSATDALIKVI